MKKKKKKIAACLSKEYGFTLSPAPQLDLPASQFSSVAQSCPTVCDPMNRSIPGLSVHHQLPEFHSDSHPSSQ